MDHIHLQQIYTAIYHRPGSRSDLGEIIRLTNLDPPTVKAGLEILIAKGLIAEEDVLVEDLRYKVAE